MWDMWKKSVDLSDTKPYFLMHRERSQHRHLQTDVNLVKLKKRLGMTYTFAPLIIEIDIQIGYILKKVIF